MDSLGVDHAILQEKTSKQLALLEMCVPTNETTVLYNKMKTMRADCVEQLKMMRNAVVMRRFECSLARVQHLKALEKSKIITQFIEHSKCCQPEISILQKSADP